MLFFRQDINVPNKGFPEMKLWVPSRGSITQIYFDSRFFDPYSSPIIPWLGNFLLRSFLNKDSISWSTSVTNDPSIFFFYVKLHLNYKLHQYLCQKFQHPRTLDHKSQTSLAVLFDIDASSFYFNRTLKVYYILWSGCVFVAFFT